MLIILFFTFVSGIAAVLAPCIWPLLPIVLSSTNSKGKSKGLGTVLGILISFTIITIAISFLITLVAFDTQSLRKISAIILVMLGITFIIPALTIKLETFLSKLSSLLPLSPSQGKTDFTGGLTTGLILGLVWSPCAAPILAIVATVSATQTISLLQIISIVIFALGLAIPLLMLTFFGSFLFNKTKFLSTKTHRMQQIFGGIISVTAITIYFNLDRSLQAAILKTFPAYTNFLVIIDKLAR